MLVPIFAVAFAVAQSRAAYIATIFGPSGSDLVENCRQVAKVERRETADEAGARECIAFVSGVLDGGQFSAKGNHVLFPVCFPPHADLNQMAKIIVKYGDDHLEKLNNGGTYIVMTALRMAFPCSVK